MQAHDIAVLCVLAKQPGRRFEVKQVAEVLKTDYHVAWNAINRLRLHGFVWEGKLTERGRIAMGIDPNWTAPDPFEKRPVPANHAATDPDQLY